MAGALDAKFMMADNPNPQTNVVRVTLAPSVAYDLDKLQRVQKDILARLGCAACCSGWDIRWDVFRSFVVDENLNVQPDKIGFTALG